ncbi:MAG: S8 family serine peptidase, partial [Candidatus Poseidoniaceae archaeon]|nr:S8 family serine peptidase [Candidatus Poseidoniaceae archaeon]
MSQELPPITPWGKVLEPIDISDEEIVSQQNQQQFEAVIRDSNMHSDDQYLQKDLDIVRKIVSFSVVITLLLTVGYIGSVLMDEGIISIRPSDSALKSQTKYQNLIEFDNMTGTGKGIRVCIVDSGIDKSHDDLEGINLVGWMDFVNGNSKPYDDHGHGTSMAGILVANGWIEGIAPNVELLVAKALQSNGSGSDSDVVEAIDWCVENNAHIISLSLGGAPGALPFFLQSGRDSGDAANDAIDKGIVVVAAAWNDGQDDDGDVASPASETAVIAVGGVTSSGTIWSGSSVGDNNGRFWPLPILTPRNDPHKKPEIVAPAYRVPVINNQGTWSLVDGTSAATVFVTGAIALLLENNPELAANGSQGSASTINDIKQYMMDSAKKSEDQNNHDDHYG